MIDKSELLTATDETIDDAVKYADPMVLRGLLYQLTGDEGIAATQATTADIRHSEPGNARRSWLWFSRRPTSRTRQIWR